MNKLKLSILKVRKIKKTAILIMSLLLAVGAAAQSHSFGDTSYVKFKYFDYVSWFDALTHGVYSNGIRVSRPSEVVQFNYTDNPNGLKVVGLSGVMATNPVFFWQQSRISDGSARLSSSVRCPDGRLRA